MNEHKIRVRLTATSSIASPKIAVTKAIRHITNLGLREAKMLVADLVVDQGAPIDLTPLQLVGLANYNATHTTDAVSLEFVHITPGPIDLSAVEAAVEYKPNVW